MRTPGVLIVLRHGESTANAAGLFTGVLDAPLSEQGIREANGATALLNAALSLDVPQIDALPHPAVPVTLFTSTLARARQTATIVAAGLARPLEALVSDWRLNERNYGALTGRSKDDVRAEFGEAQFLAWRRSVAEAPPAMDDRLFDEFAATALFRALPPAALTRTEALSDVIRRVDAFLAECVDPLLARGRTVLVIAHGNSLRALCAVLDDLDAAQIRDLNLPTGQPLVYRFDSGGHPTMPGGRYLDSVTALAAAITLANEGGT
ncbi:MULTISPECIES: 2,3-diphosphoglycerate-dependent phosphoglycerate mutase [Cryobacterium]|uniref:2,3-bisphosphoglycerate-dependent phosphoglycerate mutase n=1 Tax=Cryobacterium breve TaxID=1259258 RepID=A0ABY2IWR6_9MICO|nr:MULTISPECIES: 2,3-diphosphoglycerate-dependent phosphoglycerate mutase [Cryobacterium]TFC94761.1 2,3-diphosphoglycerate-dependent phosphoglycerate mutase [Cryobacterium sp. TmT3-12]TFC96349.1 2,3-diphosphoglycerate-dependent phosphoglycerate mutase [Cryobacterium breve]